MKDEEQDIDTTQDDLNESDLDVSDMDTDEAEPDAGEAKPSRGDRRFQKMANENRDLRDRIARMEGKLESHGQRAPEEPTFDSDQDEFNLKLLNHAKSLEAKLKRLEEKEAAAETAKKQEKIIARAMTGLGFGKQAGFAQEHLTLYVRLHPDIDADDLRDHAKKIAKQMGIGTAAKDYVEAKKADQQATKRPSQSVQGGGPPKGTDPKTNPKERLQATREEALARLLAKSNT